MSEERPLAQRVAKAFLFSGIGSLLSKLGFVAALLVTLKLLTAREFGVANIVLAIFAITESVNELGLGAALVQRKKLDKLDLDSLFWLSLLISSTIYVLIFLVSPLVAMFYEEPGLTALLRVYGLIVIVFSLYFIPRNLLVKELSFGKIAFIDAVALFFSASLMILLAWRGYGPWAIIAGDLANRLGQLVLCFMFRPYFPTFRVKFSQIVDMIRFGLYATGSRLLYNLYKNADALIVGKVFGAEALGIYALAQRLIGDPVGTLASIINQVAYPTFATLQNELDRLRKYFFTIARLSLGLIGVVLLAVAVFIDWGLQVGGYTQWLASVPIARIFAVTGILHCVSPLVPQLLNAVGLARKNFYYSLATAIVMPLAFWIGAQAGLYGVAWAWVVAYPLVVLVLFFFGANVLGVTTARFTLRLFAGIWLVLPVLAVSVALRLLLEPMFASSALLATVLGVVGTLLFGALFVYWRERETLALLVARKARA